MATRANWFLDVVVEAEPIMPTQRVPLNLDDDELVERLKVEFDAVEVVPDDPVRAGVRIDLTAPADELRAKLHEANMVERILASRGVTCELKCLADMTCAFCPVRGKDPSRETLCQVGIQQERYLARIAAVEHGATA